MNTSKFNDYLGAVVAAQEHLRFIPEELVSDAVVRAWERGGLLSPQFADDGKTITRMWVNVIAHQAGVARVGYGLTWHISEAADVDVGMNDITSACLIHDARKRLEQEARDRVKMGDSGATPAFQDNSSESELFFVQAGFSQEIARLANTNNYLGFDHLREGHATLAEKIMFYADCAVSNYDIVGYKKRFDDLLPEFERGGRYEGDQAKHIARYGKTHREVWDETMLPVQEELARIVGFGGDPNDLVKIVTR